MGVITLHRRIAEIEHRFKGSTYCLLVSNVVFYKAGKPWVFSAAINGRRCAPSTGAASCPLISRKGGCHLVTYDGLFQYTLVIIGIIGLFIAVRKKK